MSEIVSNSISDLARQPTGEVSNKNASTKLEEDVRIYEYTSAANPSLPQVPVAVHA
eukprot:gene35577-43143_t